LNVCASPSRETSMAGKEPTTGCLKDLAAAFGVVQADLTENILLVGAK
jgi:hypothetical protein